MAKKPEAIEEPQPVAPVATGSAPAKFVYVGTLHKYGPYRGFTAESVADAQGFTSEEDRKDFLDNLKAW